VVALSIAGSRAWVRRLGVGLVGLLPLLTAAHGAADERDLQPAPPWVFFAAPDEATAQAIDALIENTFADLNLVVESRERLVRRYGLWSVPRLVRELGSATNEPGILNAALTVAALRAHVGAAAELAPLVRPLIAIARSVEEWRRAAAMLALGSFQGPEGCGRPRHRADALIPLDPVAEARGLFDEVLDVLQGGLKDQSRTVRVAAALALAKTGGSAARSLLVEGAPPKDAAVDPRMAVLLARGLLAVGGEFDQDIFLEGLADPERLVRAAAALGAALQVVCDHPPGWTDAPARLVRALGASQVNTQKEDTAEAVFAKGCLAWKGQSTALWEDVLRQAVAPMVEDQVAAAAAQVLVWCDDPPVRARALAQLTTNARALKPPVLASFLLRAGWDGTPEGVKACGDWLGNAGLAPRAARDWDVRWHACVGLLRAFADGHLKDDATRRAALEALQDAVRKGLDRDAPPLEALGRLLAAHGASLAETAGGRLSEEALRDVEEACRCPYGLLGRDLREAAVARANTLLYVRILDLADLRDLAPSRDPAKDKTKDKEGTARRFFQRHLEAWPYLSRLDLLEDRGRRPAPRLAFDDPAKVLDRGPR
jgi:hypothetical protein